VTAEAPKRPLPEDVAETLEKLAQHLRGDFIRGFLSAEIQYNAERELSVEFSTPEGSMVHLLITSFRVD
jgi:hypothetical protein